MANSNDDIITLTTSSGEEIDFVEIAGIKLGTKFYEVLQPVELLEGMSDDEVLVFQVTHSGGGNKFDIVTEDKIIDKVLKKCNRMIAEANGNKQVKKSGGANKVFGATTKVVKKTFWLIGIILGIVLALMGVGVIIGGIVSRGGVGIIGMIVFIAIGIGLVSLGVRLIARQWKRRHN